MKQPLHSETAPYTGRDTRIDVFRALALVTIFINHVPGTPFEYMTHKHFGFSDSAEAFVLISGMAVGLAYGAKFYEGRYLLPVLKLWRRTLTLYSAHLLTTFATLAVFCGAAIFLHHPEFLSRINIAPVIREPAKALFGIVTLGHQLGYNNILPLYMVLMFMAPLFLYLAGKNLRLLLVASAALYLFAGIYQIAPPGYPVKGFWFLNPLSWQFLFVIGLAAVVHSKRGGRLPCHPLLLAAAILYLVAALVWVQGGLWWVDTSMGLPLTLTGFNKTFLSLPRLVHILALAYVIASIPAVSGRFRLNIYHPLAILGRYSLPVFVAGTILAMMAQVLRQVNPGGVSYDALLIATGIIVQFALAYYLEWLTMIGWRGKPVVAPLAAQADPAAAGVPAAALHPAAMVADAARTGKNHLALRADRPTN